MTCSNAPALSHSFHRILSGWSTTPLPPQHIHDVRIYTDRLVGTWTATAVFQTSTAIRDVWKSFRGERKQQVIQRLLDGESVNGWRRRILPRPADGFQYPSNVKVYTLTPVIGDQDPGTGQGGEGFSEDILLYMPTRLVDGREALHLRRYSRFRPMSTLLLEIIEKRDQWMLQFLRFVDKFTIATAFRRVGTKKLKVLFFNVKTRKVRQLMVEAPDYEARALFAYVSTSPKIQLHVIYYLREADEDNRWYLHLTNSSYDYPPVDIPNSPIVRQSSWESISVPLGNREGHFIVRSVWARVIVAYDETDVSNAESHLCISIDSKMKWRIDTMAAWLSAFQNTKIGASVSNAIQATNAFYSSQVFRDPPLYCHKYFLPVLATSEIQTDDSLVGTIQRQLAPFSLKRTAAEVVCKVNPDAKMSAIKEATGVDVSDGITEDEGGDGACEVIYL